MEHFSFRTEVLSLSYQMNCGPRLWIVGCSWIFTHGRECAGAGFRRMCRKDFLQKFCNFVFGARLHHRQLRNITFSSNFGTATRQNSFLNWKGTTVDESVSQGSVQNYRKHFKLLTYQKQKTLISRYCRSLRRTRANLGICFWVGKIIPNAWEPNTFWEFDSQYATVGEHLCRGYCLFFHCHCRPQPTFELTSLHRVSFQPAIMWWKDCRALHKTFVLMKNIVSHFFHLFKLEVFDRENNFDADPCFSSNTSRKFLFDCQNIVSWFKVSRHTYIILSNPKSPSPL